VTPLTFISAFIAIPDEETCAHAQANFYGDELLSQTLRCRFYCRGDMYLVDNSRVDSVRRFGSGNCLQMGRMMCCMFTWRGLLKRLSGLFLESETDNLATPSCRCVSSDLGSRIGGYGLGNDVVL